jgi:hypothetical protein
MSHLFVVLVLIAVGVALARQSTPISPQFDSKNVTFGYFAAGGGVPASFDLAAGSYAWKNYSGDIHIYNGCALDATDGWSLDCALAASISAGGSCVCRDTSSYNPFQISNSVVWMAYQSRWNFTVSPISANCFQAWFLVAGYDDLAYVCLDNKGVPSFVGAEDSGWLNTTIELTRPGKHGQSLLPLTPPAGCCQK